MAQKKLKIAVLTRNYNSSGGGAERYCVELTERLSKIYDVHVYSQFNDEQSPGITFHHIPQWIKRPSFLNRFIFSCLTKLKVKGKYDIVHSHALVQYADLYTFHVPCIKTKFSKSKGIKKALLWLGVLISPRKITYLLLENSQIKPALNRHFISVSEYLSRNLIQNYPQLKGHITIAYPGSKITSTNEDQLLKIRNRFRISYNIPESSFVLLFVAHGFKRKGLSSIIKAMELLSDDDIHIVVVGGGNPNEITINSNTVKTNTHFVGVVKNMDDIYPVADTLIHPTLGDTYGMVVSEAMSYKLPVIVSNSRYCGFSEHLDSKNSIILSNPRSSIEISKAINSFKVNLDLRREISMMGYKKVTRITWEQTLKQTVNAIDLIQQKRLKS